MKTYRQMIKEILKRGLTVSVFDGEEWPVKRSTCYKDIVDAIDSVEEAQIRVRDADGNVLGWALIIPGLDADEAVADYTDNALMNELAI